MRLLEPAAHVRLPDSEWMLRVEVFEGVGLEAFEVKAMDVLDLLHVLDDPLAVLGDPRVVAQPRGDVLVPQEVARHCRVACKVERGVQPAPDTDRQTAADRQRGERGSDEEKERESQRQNKR
eukprot:1348839-Rhodomonas_salina.3